MKKKDFRSLRQQLLDEFGKTEDDVKVDEKGQYIEVKNLFDKIEKIYL